MVTYKTLYRCRDCGATSYQQVQGRTETGAMRPTGQYKCSGCRTVFATIRAWWEPRPFLKRPNFPDFQPSQMTG